MIDKLVWDSNFFNLKIGKFTIDENHLNEVADSVLNQYDLVYIFSEQELNYLNPKVHLVDVKVNFSKTNLCFNEGIIISEYDNTKHNYNKLLELAILSGIHSRFKRDHRFNIGAFEKLYKTWIDKSIDKSIAQHVLVDIFDGELVGFVTLQLKPNDLGTIGLIAVDPLYQGKKIASRLLQSCENLCISNNIDKLEVSTQLENNPAMQLYKNAKFNIKNKQFIYHYWTYDTI